MGNVSQKIPVNKFEWIGETSLFNEDFIMNYNEKIGEGYFQKERKFKKQKSMLLVYMIKMNMSFT